MIPDMMHIEEIGELPRGAIAFCQKWKSVGTGTSAAYTIHASKRNWFEFMEEYYDDHFRFDNISIERELACISLNGMAPDGHPYSCEISPLAMKKIIAEGTNVKFSGTPPLPRYLYRWNPELRLLRGDDPVTIYFCNKARVAMVSQGDALSAAIEMAVNMNDPCRAHFGIMTITSVGIDALKSWGEERVKELVR